MLACRAPVGLSKGPVKSDSRRELSVCLLRQVAESRHAAGGVLRARAAPPLQQPAGRGRQACRRSSASQGLHSQCRRPRRLPVGQGSPTVRTAGDRGAPAARRPGWYAQAARWAPAARPPQRPPPPPCRAAARDGAAPRVSALEHAGQPVSCASLPGTQRGRPLGRGRRAAYASGADRPRVRRAARRRAGGHRARRSRCGRAGRCARAGTGQGAGPDLGGDRLPALSVLAPVVRGAQRARERHQLAQLVVHLRPQPPRARARRRFTQPVTQPGPSAEMAAQGGAARTTSGSAPAGNGLRHSGHSALVCCSLLRQCRHPLCPARRGSSLRAARAANPCRSAPLPGAGQLRRRAGGAEFAALGADSVGAPHCSVTGPAGCRAPQPSQHRVSRAQTGRRRGSATRQSGASPPYAPRTSVQMQHSGSALPFILGAVCAPEQMLPSASALLEEWRSQQERDRGAMRMLDAERQ